MPVKYFFIGSRTFFLTGERRTRKGQVEYCAQAQTMPRLRRWLPGTDDLLRHVEVPESVEDAERILAR